MRRGQADREGGQAKTVALTPLAQCVMYNFILHKNPRF